MKNYYVMKELSFMQMEVTTGGKYFWGDLACSISGGMNGAIIGGVIGGPVGFVTGLVVGSLMSVGCSAGLRVD